MPEAAQNGFWMSSGLAKVSAGLACRICGSCSSRSSLGWVPVIWKAKPSLTSVGREFSATIQLLEERGEAALGVSRAPEQDGMWVTDCWARTEKISNVVKNPGMGFFCVSLVWSPRALSVIQQLHLHPWWENRAGKSLDGLGPLCFVRGKCCANSMNNV